MQPQMAAVLTCAKGASMVTESIFDNRFRYVDELRRMGANISVEGRVAVIEGVERLKGAPVKATDLRAGAALIVAALGAEGVTEIYDIHHVERGYENMEVKLRSLGADIQKVDEPDPTAEESCSERLSDGEDIPDLQLQQRECYVYRHEGAWYPDRRRVQLPGAEKLAGTHRHLNVPDRGAVHHARAY